MDYEKKYNEALERAKQIRNGNPSSGTAIVVCEQIFPELRESEDERINKAIFRALSKKDARDVLLAEGVQVSDALAYLEKQKEHVPEAFMPNMTVHPGPNIPSCSDTAISPSMQNTINEESGTRKEQKPYCPSNDELEKAAKEFREKNVPPIEPISDELVEIIKDEFEGFRRLLKKKGIDYEPQRDYWEGFARLFDSSAREYVKEQKPVELSEEDEQFLLVCKNALRKYQISDHWDANIISKWLEERIKSPRPCPSWKPSEEQMEALKKTAEGCIDNGSCRIIATLLEQLKKL